MKVFVTCKSIKKATYGGKIVLLSDEDLGIMVTVLTKTYPDEKFKVGHEYELMLTE